MYKIMSYRKEEIYAKVAKILVDYDVPRTAISPSASFAEDLALDSLDRAAVALEVEKKFDIYIPAQDMDKFTSIDRVVIYIQSATE
ncbi:MAG: acyl carrier protein [Cyclobacteriaceae bacterium]